MATFSILSRTFLAELGAGCIPGVAMVLRRASISFRMGVFRTFLVDVGSSVRFLPGVSGKHSGVSSIVGSTVSGPPNVGSFVVPERSLAAFFMRHLSAGFIAKLRVSCVSSMVSSTLIFLSESMLTLEGVVEAGFDRNRKKCDLNRPRAHDANLI